MLSWAATFFIIALIAAILVFAWTLLKVIALIAADADEWIRSYSEEEVMYLPRQVATRDQLPLEPPALPCGSRGLSAQPDRVSTPV